MYDVDHDVGHHTSPCAPTDLPEPSLGPRLVALLSGRAKMAIAGLMDVQDDADKSITVSHAGKEYVVPFRTEMLVADLALAVQQAVQVDYDTIKLVAGHGFMLRPAQHGGKPVGDVGKSLSFHLHIPDILIWRGYPLGFTSGGTSCAAYTSLWSHCFEIAASSCIVHRFAKPQTCNSPSSCTGT